MPVPFTVFPALGELIAAAVRQGCTLKTVKGNIVGPRGPTNVRYLAAPGGKGPLAILPNHADDERLSPSEIANLVRILKLDGFDHYCVEDTNKNYTYVPGPGEAN